VKIVAGLVADSANAAKTEEQRAQALVDRDAAQAILDGVNELITGTQNRKVELDAEFVTMKTRQEDARTFLAQAEEKRALVEMAEQKAEFEKFQVQYNQMKGEYDTLAAKDDAGTATAADFTRMDELYQLYKKDQATFDNFEKDRILKEKENTEKAYNKELLAVEKMRESASSLKKSLALLNEAKTVAAAKITKLNTEITGLNTTLSGMIAGSTDAAKVTTQIRSKQKELT
jgi:CRISPR/Cas system-associated endonuclease/helicase Cas3